MTLDFDNDFLEVILKPQITNLKINKLSGLSELKICVSEDISKVKIQPRG